MASEAMTDFNFDLAIELTGWFGASCTALTLLPQVYRSVAINRCDMSQISLLMLMLNFFAGITTLIYASCNRVWPIVMANALNVSCTIILLSGKCVGCFAPISKAGPKFARKPPCESRGETDN